MHSPFENNLISKLVRATHWPSCTNKNRLHSWLCSDTNLLVKVIVSMEILRILMCGLSLAVCVHLKSGFRCRILETSAARYQSCNIRRMSIDHLKAM